MAVKLIKVRPTKIAFIRLKRRLALTSRVHKIVKDRLAILTMEFLQTARETVSAREKLINEFPEFYKVGSITAGYHGYIVMEKELMASERDLRISSGVRNVAGVKMPSFELESESRGAVGGYSLADTSSLVDWQVQTSKRCIEYIIEIAEAQSNLEALGQEIKKSKRISNAMEYIMIPSLKATIKFLYMKFEERDREEKSRMKRVKAIIQRK
ncbi:MAG: V-type ATP synthase subunit D [Dehalococcoidia bacterium]|nr:V-type ATP synthase subunit D [Dehalococcoidia bacterium]